MSDHHVTFDQTYGTRVQFCRTRNRPQTIDKRYVWSVDSAILKSSPSLSSCTVMQCNVVSIWRLRWRFTRQSPLQGHLTILKLVCHTAETLGRRVWRLEQCRLQVAAELGRVFSHGGIFIRPNRPRLSVKTVFVAGIPEVQQIAHYTLNLLLR